MADHSDRHRQPSRRADLKSQPNADTVQKAVPCQGQRRQYADCWVCGRGACAFYLMRAVMDQRELLDGVES